MKQRKVWIIPLVISIIALVIGVSFHGYRMHPENVSNYNLGVLMGITMAGTTEVFLLFLLYVF